MLGVCLGLQCIGELYGGEVVRAPRVMHGKTSEIRHKGAGVFADLPNPLTATRYHSLVVERDSVPDVLEVTAESEDGLVMGLRHRAFPIEGVQFHPESILTDAGHDLLAELPGAGRGRCARPPRDLGQAVVEQRRERLAVELGRRHRGALAQPRHASIPRR